jgi:hypothetical protein
VSQKKSFFLNKLVKRVRIADNNLFFFCNPTKIFHSLFYLITTCLVLTLDCLMQFKTKKNKILHRLDSKKINK